MIDRRMQRSQLRDISSWMTRLFPEPGDGSSRMIDGFKMFGSKNSSPTSTFYTDLEITEDKQEFQQEDKHSKASLLPEQQSTTSENENSQDSDTTGIEEQRYVRHSFHRIASFGGFPRFQSFVMSASTPAECIDITRHEETSTETSYIKMSHSVLEYRSSRCVEIS